MDRAASTVDEHLQVAAEAGSPRGDEFADLLQEFLAALDRQQAAWQLGAARPSFAERLAGGKLGAEQRRQAD